MRAFIAIELPQDLKQSLAQLQDKLKAAAADLKWVKPENIHLTLKFLGEIEAQKQEEIANIIEAIAGKTSPFSLRICSLGAFPKRDFPRVIWVGLDKGAQEAEKIAQGLEEKLELLGIPGEERPFSAHITLGRVKSNLNREKLVGLLTALQDNFQAGKAEFRVTKITFFKSTLTPKGPLYEALKTINLKTD